MHSNKKYSEEGNFIKLNGDLTSIGAHAPIYGHSLQQVKDICNTYNQCIGFFYHHEIDAYFMKASGTPTSTTQRTLYVKKNTPPSSAPSHQPIYDMHSNKKYSEEGNFIKLNGDLTSIGAHAPIYGHSLQQVKDICNTYNQCIGFFYHHEIDAYFMKASGTPTSTTQRTLYVKNTPSASTLPPATLPPATLPPATLPPATLPPATLPPVTLPPAPIISFPTKVFSGQGTYTWTAPFTGTLNIECYGASGGFVRTVMGGHGGFIYVKMNVTEGVTYDIVVGNDGKNTNSSWNSGGGGGGTGFGTGGEWWVIAGGGGGAGPGNNSIHPGGNGGSHTTYDGKSTNSNNTSGGGGTRTGPGSSTGERKKGGSGNGRNGGNGVNESGAIGFGPGIGNGGYGGSGRNDYAGGGGGGGWFGGSGGGVGSRGYGIGGGGGSSYYMTSKYVSEGTGVGGHTGGTAQQKGYEGKVILSI
jgi:hypothetical protein